FQAEDGIRDFHVTGVQTCALPIFRRQGPSPLASLRGTKEGQAFLPPPQAPVAGTFPPRFAPGDKGKARLSSRLRKLRRQGKARLCPPRSGGRGLREAG